MRLERLGHGPGPPAVLLNSENEWNMLVTLAKNNLRNHGTRMKSIPNERTDLAHKFGRDPDKKSVSPRTWLRIKKTQF